MASPSGPGERQWSATPWLPLAYAEVTRSPDTYGVVILGDEHRDPILVDHGSIRDELWRFPRSPRTAAQGGVYFRFIATVLEREAELLAVIVRDEPTGFMDSWAEAEWFARFRALARGRTGIVITHRFTIAMRADVIHVMRQGRIVESGTHHELLAQDGLYAQSWRAQMEGASRIPEGQVTPSGPA